MTSAEGLRLLPFRGLRYAPERVGSLTAVTSPPYDVVVRPEGVRHLETADPYNIVRLILPHAADPATRHRQAADTLRHWRAEGVLTQDAEPALYVYEQRAGAVLQRGLIGALCLDGPVLPHEDVIPEVVEDRAALMRAAAANFEPLLLSYRGRNGANGATAVIERTVAGPPLLATTTEDGVTHRLWAVTDPVDLAAVDHDLSRRQALIADGHHRWATYRRLYEQQPGATAASPWASGLVLLVDTARYPLQVRAIHRVLPHLPTAKALADLAGAFRARTLQGGCPPPWRRWTRRPVRPSSSPAARRPSTSWTVPSPGCWTARSAGTAPRSGAGWTPPCCIPSCSTRSGTSLTTRPTSAICTMPRPPWSRPRGTAGRRC